ncbi:MAG: MaoC/PaaZ C-terminal domain-containing protein [Halopseudomonas sp.]|uniref:MaoC/PaaZ C-terminal domain-containing protein n=1 Tax=Halopseudomonas sp. TaxID=2901191 RepID=UPI003002C413
MQPIIAGYSFEQHRVFSVAELQELARLCGDSNPLHHDLKRAQASRFGGLIASGSAISAVFSAMIPAHIGEQVPMLGLEMSFRFNAPVRPDVAIVLRWQVVEVQARKAQRSIATLQGEVRDGAQNLLIAGSAKIMLLAEL